MNKLYLSIWDHDKAQGGYHFRCSSGRPEWDKLVKEENHVIQSLTQEELDERVRITPLSPNHLAILATKRIRSDGRNARKTASILIESNNVPIRWKFKLIELVKKGLETSNIGGELTFNLEEAQVTPHHKSIAIPNVENLQGVMKFQDNRLDHIMAIWSMLPPEQRMRTEVIFGNRLEDEHLFHNMKCLFHVQANDSSTNTAPINMSSRFSISGETFWQENLERAAVIADSTGVEGLLWQRVVAAETQRRGNLVSGGNHFQTYMDMANFDHSLSRRGVWRDMAVKSLIEDNSLSYDFFVRLGMLTVEELMNFPLQSMAKVVSVCLYTGHTIEAHPEFASLKMEGGDALLFDTLTSYFSALDEQSWEYLLNEADLGRWFKDAIPEFEVFLTTLFTHYPSHITTVLTLLPEDNELEEKAVNDAQFGQLLYSALRNSPNPIPSEIYTNSNISEMSIIPSKGQDRDSSNVSERWKDRYGKPLGTQLSAIFELQWTDMNTVIQYLANRHVVRDMKQLKVDSRKLEMLEEFINNSSSQPNSKHLVRMFKIFVEQCEVQWKQHPSRELPLDEALLLAPYGSTQSVWFQRIISSGNRNAINSLLRNTKISIHRLPIRYLKSICETNPKMIGWPGPFGKIRGEDKQYKTRCQLFLQPTPIQRFNRLFAWISLVTSLISALILVYTTPYLTFQLPFESNIKDLTILDLGSTFFGGTFLISLLIFLRYFTNKRYLRKRPKGGD